MKKPLPGFNPTLYFPATLAAKPVLNTLLKAHSGLWFLIPFAVIMVFTGLSDTVLQGDEGADTLVAATILKYGLPMHSDGINSTMLFADIHDGIFVYRTWVPYYLQALSMEVFGQTSFAARLPFALAGFLSIIATYFFAFKLSKNKVIAFLAGLFLATSVPALIFFRTARYFALPVLLTIILLYTYIRIFDKKEWRPAPFILTAIIYFHSMYVECAGILLGVLIHFLVHRGNIRPENQKKVLQCAAIIGIFCIPWLYIIYPVFSIIPELLASTSESIDNSAIGYFKHVGGYLFQINNYIFPFVMAPLLFIGKLKNSREVHLLIIVITTILMAGSLHSMPQQSYITGSFPLFYILLAYMIVWGIKRNLIIKLALTLFLITTNIVHVGLLLPARAYFKERPHWLDHSLYLRNAHSTFVRETVLTSVYFKYWQEITHHYQGPLDRVVRFFELHANPGETCYIDNEPEALAFHTGLRVIHKHQLTVKIPPDWIVLRGDHKHIESGSPDSPAASKVADILETHPYRRVLLDAPVQRVNNSYDIQLHLFRSPVSADKISVYRLIKPTIQKM